MRRVGGCVIHLCADCQVAGRRIAARRLCHICYRKHRKAGTLVDWPTQTPTRACPEVPGLSYRQLDYWVRVGYLRPGNPTGGSGTVRSWPDDELAVAQTMARLVAAGLTVAAAHMVARGDAEIAPGVRVLVEPVVTWTTVAA